MSEPFVISLNKEEMAHLFWALYLAYGNEFRALNIWEKLRKEVGEEFQMISDRSSEIGREKHPAHPEDLLKRP